ncbi:hypothetical protein [Aeromicrobium sp. 9AM]|uniref:hypothetical protein n=1 Tax=Aeromicrobium sp. 9AM TaxID=2653126 RepID=UPI00135C6FA5|nr:hypothetical protein [Aeromicrobium sp. 9AM]
MTANDPTAPDAPRVLKAGCRVTDSRPCPQHFDIADHRLDPRNKSWVHPVLSERGYWICPPLECVADSNVLHDIDDIHLCRECMPEEVAK